MNLVQRKISKTGKLISAILFVACALTALAVFLLLVAVIALAFSNSPTVASLHNSFIITSSSGSIDIISTKTLVILFLLAVLQLAITFSVLFVLYRIFLDISRSYTPFEKKHVIRMKQVAILTFAMCITTNICDWVGSILLQQRALLEIDIMWLVIAIVIYCIAHIFDYGYQLQTQSDETL